MLIDIQAVSEVQARNFMYIVNSNLARKASRCRGNIEPVSHAAKSQIGMRLGSMDQEGHDYGGNDLM